MELERLIGEKIRQEELKPIRWEKERVWNAIQRDKKSTGYSAYFIAASVALATCLSFYFIQVKLDQPMFIQNAMQESNVDLCNQEIQTTAIAESIKSIENCEDGIVQSRQISKGNENLLVSIPTITMKPLHDSINLAKIEVPMLDSIHVPSLAIDERFTDAPLKIEAIIGVIPVDQKNISIAKEKKLRIKFSRDHYEYLSDDNPKKQVITARIN